MKKSISPTNAAAMIPDGATLMIGGFMGVGSPHRLIDAIIAAGKRNLTVIANDTARRGVGIGKMIAAGLVSRVVASHIGLNPLTQKGMLSHEIDVELVPQGTLAERIRAGGFGLGGVLPRTGLGTLAAEGQRIIEIDGQQWLYASPLRADFALIHADRADHGGSLAYQLTAMALAAKTVICEPREIVPVGVIPSHGRRHGSCVRSMARDCDDAAHCERDSEDRPRMHPPHHRYPSRHFDSHRVGRDRTDRLRSLLAGAWQGRRCRNDPKIDIGPSDDP